MQTQTESRRLVDVPAALESPLSKKLFSLVGTPLCIDYQLDPSDIERLPTTGPVIVVANHPFGAVEGLVLADILTKRRQDVRIMANALLGKIPEMQPWLLGNQGVLSHLPSLESGQRWLESGGVLLTFPAESVSHLHFRSRTVVDPPWSQKVATLARRTNATVVPVFFEGRNSALFQIAGFVHPRLRTALLRSNSLGSSGNTISLRIGKPISPEKTQRFAEDKELTEYLRFKTYALANRENLVRPRFRRKPAATVAPVEISPAIPAEVLKNEVARLPTDAKLIEQGPYVVYLARQPQIPAVMREIGHLREKTFRAVGEGTGQALDLDDFDKHYLHLFMWNKDTNEVIGSYRLGVADQILDSHGMSGLYTSTLFKSLTI
jgi:putative hemolysin